MNNKRIGTDFENEFCELLANMGYWVHFIAPDRSGAQPFDVIAARDDKAYAFDCKTCVSNTFNISRLEDNQIMAFDKWLKCHNKYAYIAVKHKGVVRLIEYTELKIKKSVKLSEAKWFGIIYN